MTLTKQSDPSLSADALARRHFRRNATMLATEIAGFMMGIAFVSPTTVLPVFVTQLGGSPLLVGLVATCQTAGWLLPQLLGASICAGKPRMMPYILRPLYAGRPAFLALAAAALILGAGQPWLLLALLYVAVALFFATDGISTVPWYEFIGRAIPPDRRGRMIGIAQVVGGLGAMAAGALVTQVLARPEIPFPNNYALLFGISGTIFLINIVPFKLVIEPEYRPEGKEAFRPSVRQFLGMLLPILRSDRNFVRLVAVRLLFGSLLGTFSFYVLYLERQFSLGPERLGLFISAQVFGNLIGGLVVGWVADHLGTKVVIRLAGLVVTLIPILGLGMLVLTGGSTNVALYAGCLLFVLIGVTGSTNLIGFMNYLMEVAPAEMRSTYVGLFNTIAGILLVIPPLAGWFLETTSFAALFAVSAGFAALCLLLSFGLRKPLRR